MTAPIEDIQRLQAQISSAFADLPLPPAETLLRSDLDKRWSESYEGVRRQFAGRSWEDLNGEFLWGSASEHQPIHGYGYFSAQGFQYYLAPVLLASLDGFEESNAYLYSVISLLTPSFAHLHEHGSDRTLEEHRTLFTAEQNQVVCAFLELVFDHLPRFRWSSAKALRWGWGHVDGSAAARVRAFYHALHNYTYPPVADPGAQELAQAIRHTFDHRPYPGDDQLVLTGCGDEPWEYALEFRGMNWRTLHPTFLAAHSPSLCFFSEAGFRYFLPAYLLASVCAPEVVEEQTFHLTHGLSHADVRAWEDLECRFEGKSAGVREAFAVSKARFDDFQRQTRHIDWKSRAEMRFGGLTRSEHQVVVRYLQYHQGQLGKFTGEMITEALSNYWLPALRCT